MVSLCVILVLLFGFSSDAKSKQNLHPAVFGDDSTSVAAELSWRGCFDYYMNIIGKKFGKLRAVSFAEKKIFGGRLRNFYNCVCDCGGEKVVFCDSLIRGGTRSCGCLHRDTARKVNLSHGGYKHELYITWRNMLRRCSDNKIPAYARYGGRGIKVCQRWHSFRLFVKDVSAGKSPGLTLNRKDNDGDYCPSNVVWSTQLEQMNNMGRNRFFEIDGRKMSMKNWCRELGVKYSVVQARVRVLGWSFEDAVSIPVGQRRQA